MDVSLILTHRCNLACGYCYAGEHHKTDIEDDVLERGVELLFSDGAPRAQLSFFGGEPFLGFDAMRRAVALAEARAAELGRELVLQCTTNGTLVGDEQIAFIRAHDVHVTVSIDGVREAHDLNRPCAGGKPSFDQVYAGLRRLLDAGVRCDAMMVITPQTAEHLYLSTNFLWSEGVETIRANVALEEIWDDARLELREQLVSVGWELLARRMRGEPVSFKPFDAGIRSFHASAEPVAPAPARAKVVVGTRGHLYPCAPMVGEDRDDGPEALLRIGHLDDGPAAIARAVATDGVRCERGKECACAAYLETGDRYTAGKMGRYYGRVCAEIGRTVAESLARQQLAQPKPRRRHIMMGLTAIVGGAAVGAPLLAGLFDDEPPPRPCQLRTRKHVAQPTDLPVPGEMPAPDIEVVPDGAMVMPDPEPMIQGDVMAPVEPDPSVDGDFAEPVETIDVLGDFE